MLLVVEFYDSMYMRGRGEGEKRRKETKKKGTEQRQTGKGGVPVESAAVPWPAFTAAQAARPHAHHTHAAPPVLPCPPLLVSSSLPPPPYRPARAPLPPPIYRSRRQRFGPPVPRSINHARSFKFLSSNPIQSHTTACHPSWHVIHHPARHACIYMLPSSMRLEASSSSCTALKTSSSWSTMMDSLCCDMSRPSFSDFSPTRRG